MKKIHRLSIFCLIAALIVTTIVSGIHHDQRRPNQRLNQFSAVRCLSVWSFFGIELYAKNQLAVYDMTDQTIDSLPQPIGIRDVQVRRFGSIADGGRQFNLGENDYDRDECIDYIYWTLGTSSDVSHRILATQIFFRSMDQYPLSASIKDDLLEDSSDVVRDKMRELLAHTQ